MADQEVDAQHWCGLGRRMIKAHLDGEMCDFELVCNGQTIRIHKMMICLQSPVISAACTGSFKEASGRYEMKDCDIDSVRRMVNFLYKGDYDCEESEKTHPIAAHIAMFALADKYLIDSLLSKSKLYFTEAVEDERDLDILSQYTKAVYGLPFDSSNCLRSALIAEFKYRINFSATGSDLEQSLDRLLGEVPGFAKDMALSYIQGALRASFLSEDELKERLAAEKQRRIPESASVLVDDDLEIFEVEVDLDERDDF